MKLGPGTAGPGSWNPLRFVFRGPEGWFPLSKRGWFVAIEVTAIRQGQAEYTHCPIKQFGLEVPRNLVHCAGQIEFVAVRSTQVSRSWHMFAPNEVLGALSLPIFPEVVL